MANSMCSYKLEVGKVYNFRVVTSPALDNEIRVCCYINNDLVIDATTSYPSGNQNQCGIRMAASVTNRIANIKISDNTPKYAITLNQVINGSVEVDKTNAKHGEYLNVKITPQEGYYLSSLKINDKEMTSDVSNDILNLLVEEDIEIDAKFSLIPEVLPYVSLNCDTYELYALESFTLIPSTTESNPIYSWSSSNENVVSVSNGYVFAVGTGTATVTVTMGTSTASCEVTVKVAEGYNFKSVYGSGMAVATTTNGVYTFGKNGVQADLVCGNETLELKYFEIEMNLILGCNVGVGGNFGFQFYKTKNASGSAASSYMFRPMTGTTNNVSITKDQTASTVLDKASYTLEKGIMYRIKIVVMEVENGTKIEGYIDGNLVCSYIETESLIGSIFGIRCGALSDNNAPHKVAIVSVSNINCH